MRIKQKQTKIGTKRVFSYKKAKNKVRKRRGLSPVSTLGLTLAFNNRNIGKKVILSLICSVMIGLILLTSALIFSSEEQTFCKHMKKNDVPVVSYYIYPGNRNFEKSQLDRLHSYIEDKYGAKSYVFRWGSGVIHKYIDDIRPAEELNINEEIKQQFSLSGNAIYTDDPSELGLKIIHGTRPKKKGEVAVSKYYYNMLRAIGKFVNVNNEVFDFNTQFEFGKYIDEFHFAITGVFDDTTNDNIDVHSKETNWRSIVNYNNELARTYLLPKSEEIALESFLSTSGTHRITFEGSGTRHAEYCGYLPLNEMTKNYYYNDLAADIELAADEIIISDHDFCREYAKVSGKKLEVGAYINLAINEVRHAGPNLNVIKQFETRTFRIKDIIEGANFGVMMSQEAYDASAKSNKLISYDYYINSKYVTPGALKDIKKYFYTQILGEDNYMLGHINWGLTSTLTFDMINYEPEDGMRTTYVTIFNTYVGIPLFVICAAVVAIILCVLMSDMVSAKNRDILILKSMGANPKEIIKIFAITGVLILSIQLVTGILGGFAMLYGLNIFWARVMGNYEIYHNTFWIGWANVLLTICAILTIVAITLWYSIQRLSGKNLRKMFQRQKA